MKRRTKSKFLFLHRTMRSAAARKDGKVKVLIVQSVLKHYRLPFFRRLHDVLSNRGIELTVAYSHPNRAHAARGDNATISDDWGAEVKGYWFFNRLIYQPLWRQIAESDLVIVGSEIKYLINPFLLMLSSAGLKKVAFWGLGPNAHPDRSPAAEWIKERLATKVDWWFAYTETVKNYLSRKGMPPTRITTVQNATDTTELRRLINEIPDEEVLAAKGALTGSTDSTIGFYCGMMHRIKSIPFLIETARRVKARVPGFHLVLIGDGPERPSIVESVVDTPWIHYLGSKFGRDSALYYKMADVFLLGGTAGLAIVDSFAAGLPLLATALPTHPPEIEYVRDGENGRLAPHNAELFANVIVDVLSDDTLIGRLRAGAKESARRISIEAMVDNFSEGVASCLSTYVREQ